MCSVFVVLVSVSSELSIQATGGEMRILGVYKGCFVTSVPCVAGVAIISIAVSIVALASSPPGCRTVEVQILYSGLYGWPNQSLLGSYIVGTHDLSPPF